MNWLKTRAQVALAGTVITTQSLSMPAKGPTSFLISTVTTPDAAWETSVLLKNDVFLHRLVLVLVVALEAIWPHIGCVLFLLLRSARSGLHWHQI
jgi:hypothetical protein